MNRLVKRSALLAGLFAAFSFVSASAGTIATFADPALDGSTPLFSLTPTQFQGGWSGNGLTLLTPGLPGPDYSDAKFNLPAVSVTPISPGLWTLGNGQITFYDSANTPVFIIAFAAASLDENIGMGASDLALQNVTFSVPGSPQTFDQERFAFSFANEELTPNGPTWTASFTSSAIPEPASLGLTLIGLFLCSARRRRS